MCSHWCSAITETNKFNSLLFVLFCHFPVVFLVQSALYMIVKMCIYVDEPNLKSFFPFEELFPIFPTTDLVSKFLLLTLLANLSIFIKTL